MATMIIVCAYCKKQIGVKICSQEMGNMVSHGCCNKCAEKENAKIDKMIADNAAKCFREEVERVKGDK